MNKHWGYDANELRTVGKNKDGEDKRKALYVERGNKPYSEVA